MESYTTLNAAKAAAADKPKCLAIAHVQLDSGDDGYVTISAIVPVDFFVKHNVPGIKKAYEVIKYTHELTDAQKLSREINKWQDKADRADSYDAKHGAERKVEQLEAEYAAKYPEAAKADRKSSLLAAAAKMRDEAKQALTFDADGSLHETARQERHDKMIAKAEQIEINAAAL